MNLFPLEPILSTFVGGVGLRDGGSGIFCFAKAVLGPVFRGGIFIDCASVFTRKRADEATGASSSSSPSASSSLDVKESPVSMP